MVTEKICYVCLTNYNENELINLYKSDIDNVTYFDKLKFILGNAPRFSQYMNVCEMCLKNLDVSYTFKKLVLKTQYSLSNVQHTNKETILNENIIEQERDENDDDYNKLECILSNNVIGIALTNTKIDINPNDETNYNTNLYITNNFHMKIDTDNTKILTDKTNGFIENDKSIIVNDIVTLNNSDFLQPNCNCKLSEIDMVNGHICFKKEEKILDINNEETLSNNELVINIEQSNESSYVRSKSEQKSRKKDIENSKSDDIFQCYTCDLVFNKKWKLQKHITRNHTPEKNYVCTYCNRGFKQSYHLREHLTIHTGERNYVCHVCGKTFQRLSSQKRHIKSHDAAPGQKTKRTPFLCTICGKSFPFSNGVQRHMRTHLGIKQHECNVCNRRFTQSTHLQVHMRTHTGEKPYVCDICGEAFSLKTGLRKHMASHNNTVKIEPNFNG